MRSTFCRPYDEEFAMRCITKVFPELEWNLSVQRKDPPDLADAEKDVGVEVVRAVDPEDAELSNLYAQYANQSIKNVPSNLLKKIERFSSKLICNNEGKIIGAGFKTKDDLYEIIERRIFDKTERLNEDDYPNFKIDCLFVYNSEGFCFENGLIELMHKIEKECYNYKRKFELYFIFCSHEVFLCNQTEKTVLCRELNDNDIETIKKESLFGLGRGNEYEKRSNFLVHK